METTRRRRQRGRRSWWQISGEKKKKEEKVLLLLLVSFNDHSILRPFPLLLLLLRFPLDRNKTKMAKSFHFSHKKRPLRVCVLRSVPRAQKSTTERGRKTADLSLFRERDRGRDGAPGAHYKRKPLCAIRIAEEGVRDSRKVAWRVSCIQVEHGSDALFRMGAGRRGHDEK